MKYFVASFSMLIIAIFYALFFYFFATPIFISIFIGGSFGIVYFWLSFIKPLSIVSLSHLLLAEFMLLLIVFLYSYVMGEAWQLFSLYLLPLHIIFLIFLSPIMTIPILGYVILLIIIHRELISKNQYFFLYTLFGIMPYIVGIVWIYVVRIT